MCKTLKQLSIVILFALAFTVLVLPVSAGTAQVSLSRNKFTKAEAANITATYSGVTGPKPWMGIYKRDVTPAPGTGPSLAWKDISAGNGTFDLKGLQDASAWEASGTGEYKICLFSDYDPVNGVYPLIAQVNFEIINSTPSLSLNKTAFTKSEVAQIVATYKNITGSRPWMGIYDRNATPGADGVKSLAWKDIPAGDGTFDFSGLSDVDDWNKATRGEFKLCVFADYDKVNGIYPILAQVNFSLAEKDGGSDGTGREPVNQTGDNFSIIVMALLAIMSAAGVMVSLKKQKA